MLLVGRGNSRSIYPRRSHGSTALVDKFTATLCRILEASVGHRQDVSRRAARPRGPRPSARGPRWAQRCCGAARPLTASLEGVGGATVTINGCARGRKRGSACGCPRCSWVPETLPSPSPTRDPRLSRRGLGFDAGIRSWHIESNPRNASIPRRSRRRSWASSGCRSGSEVIYMDSTAIPDA